jgi:signal transduction histidine kinase
MTRHHRHGDVLPAPRAYADRVNALTSAAGRRRWLSSTPGARVTDSFLAGGLLAWAATDVPWWWRPAGHSAATPVVLGYVLLMLLQSVPFLWWRRWPVVVAALAATVLAVRAGLGQNQFAASAAVLVGAYGLGAWGGQRLRLATRGLTVAAAVSAAAVLMTSDGRRLEALPLALLATALGLGQATAANREAAAASVSLAHQRERARIARELHDVLSHQLSAIAVQAGAARLAGRADPAEPARAIERIENIAREGLIDLNRIVGALRHSEGEQLDRHPQPRLGDLPDLIAGARAAGLRVDLCVSGAEQTLPTAVELAAYRVVQESLTNALRYARQASTRVQLTYAAEGLDLLIEDDGSLSARTTGAPAGRQLAGGKRGLAGLAERAQILGGKLDAGPRAGGGFEVHAWLPASQ